METVILKALMCVWGIFWNILIVLSIFNDSVLRKSSTFLLLSAHFIACAIDVGSRLVFDVPSEILNRPLFQLSANYTDFPTKLFHFTTYSGWFFQLYTLIVIALSHIIAVYYSLFYAKITTKQTLYLILILLLLSMFSVSYLWGNFPIIFDTAYWGWAEDRTQPWVQFFFYFNYVVQGIVFTCLFVADVMIIYKISSIKKSALFSNERSVTVRPGAKKSFQVDNQISAVNPSRPTQSRLTISTELKVSLNFIIVSLFLLTQTLIYIVCPLYDTSISTFFLFIAPLFRGSKCLAYLVSGSALRTAIKNLIFCRKQF